MKPLRTDEIKGNWATVLLPINADDSIDYERLADEVDVLVAAGVDGMYSNGTAGEFYTQTEAEFDRVSAILAERCEAASVPFQIGASHMSPQLSLDRVRRAARLAPSAIQVILSDWFPLTVAESVACLERYAEVADPVPLVLYNPPHAKRVLKPETLGVIRRRVPAVVGVKVADGDEAWYAAIREHATGLSVFVPGHNLATGFARGAAGAYSNVACLHPIGAQRWYSQMQTDLAAALVVEGRIQRFLRECILPFHTEQGYCNAALDKCMAVIGGWADVGSRLRWPYRFIPQDEAERLRPLAQRALPELFSDS
ncbi:MAG: dihydrodipicolinate synthase family protein [Phycisphaerae bacterium]|nr:dihydrodipicolinate synthase family protein [Phycisphaerae bacterium]